MLEPATILNTGYHYPKMAHGAGLMKLYDDEGNPTAMKFSIEDRKAHRKPLVCLCLT